MPLEAGLIAYTALTSLAMVDKRRHPKPALRFVPPFDHARLAGIALMALSFLAAIYRFGIGQGVVAWIGQLSIAAVAFVLLLSWRPRIAVLLAMAALPVALVLALLHFSGI